MPAQVPINTIELKLFALRTLYAIYYLSHQDRLNDLTSYLIRHPYGDIERALLTQEEMLYIESISYGSWVLAVWAKTKTAYKALSSAAGLAFDRGREAFLSRLEGEARLVNAQARKEGILAAVAEFELGKKQLEYLKEVSDKITIPEVNENLERITISATRRLTADDPYDAYSYRALTYKDDKKT